MIGESDAATVTVVATKDVLTSSSRTSSSSFVKEAGKNAQELSPKYSRVARKPSAKLSWDEGIAISNALKDFASILEDKHLYETFSSWLMSTNSAFVAVLEFYQQFGATNLSHWDKPSADLNLIDLNSILGKIQPPLISVLVIALTLSDGITSIKVNELVLAIENALVLKLEDYVSIINLRFKSTGQDLIETTKLVDRSPKSRASIFAKKRKIRAPSLTSSSSASHSPSPVNDRHVHEHRRSTSDTSNDESPTIPRRIQTQDSEVLLPKLTEVESLEGSIGSATRVRTFSGPIILSQARFQIGQESPEVFRKRAIFAMVQPGSSTSLGKYPEGLKSNLNSNTSVTANIAEIVEEMTSSFSLVK
jgi:hypothetical protein